MFKAIISAALVLSPLAFAEDMPAGGEAPVPAPTRDAAPADKPAKAHHGHKGGGHHGHKAEKKAE